MAAARESMRLLRMLANLHPELWEIIHPHEPALAAAIGRLRPGVRVGLNPQPLPPKELAASVLSTVTAIAGAAAVAQYLDRDPAAILADVGDDWCPTRPQPKIPWPRRFPVPWPPGPDPDPREIEGLTAAIQAQAALAFQAFADTVADERLAAGFADLSERLAQASIEGAQV